MKNKIQKKNTQIGSKLNIFLSKFFEKTKIKNKIKQKKQPSWNIFGDAISLKPISQKNNTQQNLPRICKKHKT